MAERRMFARTIIDSDAFLDMPVTARLLYYDLGMRADDDGFVNSPKKIMRTIGASVDDMNILIAKKFVIPFENGIVVIKHWRINNYLRKDRYSETKYSDEKSMLSVDKNGSYHIKSDVGIPHGIPVVDAGKDSIGKLSIDKDSISSNEDIIVGKPDYTSQVVEIINYLNTKTGSHYRANAKGNRDIIIPRLKDGYSVDDFKRIIDNKCSAWLNDKSMEQYLRPETLFCLKHFESYLNEKPQLSGREKFLNDES